VRAHLWDGGGKGGWTFGITPGTRPECGLDLQSYRIAAYGRGTGDVIAVVQAPWYRRRDTGDAIQAP
jgi:hypothetical protein